jgi:RNA polymerase sigma-70 factor (ECF subfamily)
VLKFRDLYRSYATEIYRFAIWLTGNRLDAEDITSETLIRAWAHGGKIRTETLRAFLFTVTRNVYLEYQRKAKRQVSLEDTYPDPSPGPDRLVESKLELQQIQNDLQALPEIDRAAFLLRIQHDLPYAEIARVLELSLSNTKVKIHRVRKKLIFSRIDKEVC